MTRLLAGFAFTFLAVAETWTCNIAQWQQISVLPTNPCGGYTYVKFQQVASYNVWVYNEQLQTQGTSQAANVSGDGFCPGVGIYTPIFTAGMSGNQWSVTVQNQEVQFGPTAGDYNHWISITTSVPITLSLPPCECFASDCCNASRGNQCSFTCPVHQCKCATGAVQPLDLCTPILIDLTGGGYQLSDPAGGVLFDFFNDGRPFQIAWPTAASGNGWLALPDRDGRVTSAEQLFGSLTPQPPSAHPNGFAALAVYDANGDGVIDAQDAIWPRLRVWVDANHNGISDPGELLTMEEAGILSVSVKARYDPRVDQYGNFFGLEGTACRANGVHQPVWDVWLQ